MHKDAIIANCQTLTMMKERLTAKKSFAEVLRVSQCDLKSGRVGGRTLQTGKLTDFVSEQICYRSLLLLASDIMLNNIQQKMWRKISHW